jgi:hypothetical protein
VQGRALIQQGQVQAGLTLLDEAMVAVTVGELSPIMTGLIYCSVIEVCQQAYALDRAHEWTAALAQWCAQQPEMIAFTATCLVHRAACRRGGGAARSPPPGMCAPTRPVPLKAGGARATAAPRALPGAGPGGHCCAGPGGAMCSRPAAPSSLASASPASSSCASAPAGPRGGAAGGRPGAARVPRIPGGRGGGKRRSTCARLRSPPGTTCG